SSGSVRGVAVKASGANLVDVALQAGSAKVGARVGDVKLPEGELIVCIVRDGKPVVPTPDAVIQAGDELIFYSQTLDVEALRELVAG
ncbi:MAG TPA: TrkA C-terminal domain-containing protein, partial [Candidatus Dormibacteraeota bacterium]|nr:TrkA C-terminal domain-containing protein [Candidatus Dormibacteraeota bacterium]